MKPATVVLLASSSDFAARIARQLAHDTTIRFLATSFTIADAMSALTRTRADLLLVDMRTAGVSIAALDASVTTVRLPVSIFLLFAPRERTSITYHNAASDIMILPDVDSPILWQAFAKDLGYRMHIAAATKERKAVKLSYGWRPGMMFSTGFRGIVAIGASAGGTEATQELMRTLPANMPGILIVQHMPPVFTRIYAERLNDYCAMQVREAKDGDVLQPGLALVAPGGMQCRLEAGSSPASPIVRCRGTEKVSGHCPSVDAMFDSVAKVQGRNAVGIILTGMGGDGAEGLLAMKKAGCHTIGQDEATSMVYGMPHVAFQKGGVTAQLPLNEISLALCTHLTRTR